MRILNKRDNAHLSMTFIPVARVESKSPGRERKGVDGGVDREGLLFSQSLECEIARPRLLTGLLWSNPFIPLKLRKLGSYKLGMYGASTARN